MVYRPVYVPEGPLRYSTKGDQFVGSFLLGLQDTVRPTDEQELGSPVRIRFGGDEEYRGFVASGTLTTPDGRTLLW